MYGITEVVKSEGIANGYEVVRSLEKGLLKGKVMDPSSLHPLEVKLLTLSFKSASDGRKVFVTAKFRRQDYKDGSPRISTIPWS